MCHCRQSTTKKKKKKRRRKGDRAKKEACTIYYYECKERRVPRVCVKRVWESRDGDHQGFLATTGVLVNTFSSFSKKKIHDRTIFITSTTATGWSMREHGCLRPFRTHRPYYYIIIILLLYSRASMV